MSMVVPNDDFPRQLSPTWRDRLAQRWLRLKSALPVLKSLVVIFMLFGLDIRDSAYKLVWIGWADSFHFQAGSTLLLLDDPVVAMEIAGGNATLGSGWPSLTSRCESITPFCAPGSTFFLSALLSNCQLDGAIRSEATITMASLVLVADARADAMAWASCTLLFVARRPPICQEEIVASFNERYAFTAKDVPASWMAQVNSAAEEELLRFLDLLSLSVPLHHVVCGEAFQLDPPSRSEGGREYEGRLYVCASPSEHRSEFLGAVHPPVHFLLDDKAWLTVDVLQFMNLRWGIRQNVHSRFHVRSISATKPSVDQSAVVSTNMQLTTVTAMNFSSFGQIYVLLVILDAGLLVLHFLSSLEILAWVLYPTARSVRNSRLLRQLSSIRARMALKQAEGGIRRSFRSRTTSLKLFFASGSTENRVELPRKQQSRGQPDRTGAADDGGAADQLLNEEFFYSFFSRSLYRSPSVVVATCVSQLLSWLLVLPNSVVWTWSDSVMQKLQAYMSSIRVWVLLLLLVNGTWNLFVLVQEEQAYRLARCTYLTSVELLAIGAFVSFVLRDEVFAMCETKWKLERQRLYDVTSFPGFLAHSNSFNLAQDSVMVTPADVAWVQYGPLLRLLANSFAAVLLYTALKSAFLSRRSDVAAWNRRRWRTRRGQSAVAATRVLKPRTSLQDLLADNHQRQKQPPRYEWSDLETLLNCPVRAKSLIRNSMELEVVDDDGGVQVAPSCALDFGVMVRDGVARSRICFSGVFTKSHKRVSPGTATPLGLSATRTPLLRRRTSVTRNSTEQAPVLLTNDTTWSPPTPDTSHNGR